MLKCNSIGHFAVRKLTEAIVVSLLFACLLSTVHEQALPPNGIIFWLLTLFVSAYVGGEIVTLINGPPLVGMLIAGFVLRNTSPMKLNDEVSSILRNIALTVILLRAGLGLDPQVLKKLSAVCLRLSFTPCIVETISTAITTHLILDLPWRWGFLLGFALAAVSPAVVVPGMLGLTERRLGTDKGIPTLVIAAASVDDVLAITGFGVLLGVVFASNASLVWQILKGPIEAIVGIVVGAAIGLLLWYLPVPSVNTDLTVPKKQRLAILLFAGLGVVFVSRELHWSAVGPLASLTLAFVAALRWRESKHDVYVEDVLKFIWFFCQPFLFGLIGAEVNLESIQLDSIAYCVLCLIIGLIFRCAASALVVWGANFTLKEKLFIALSWLPKATVQAAVGPVALDLARKHNYAKDIELATLVLNFAVLSIIVTAPLGAILVAMTSPKLLNKEIPAGVDNVAVTIDDEEKRNGSLENKDVPGIIGVTDL